MTLSSSPPPPGSAVRATPLVLVVDDSRSVRTLVKVYLSGRGFEFLEAGTPDEALRLLEQRPANLIITDYNMPGMNGAAFTQKVRGSARSQVRTAPIIMLTSDPEVEERRMTASATGVNAFLRKPASCAQLMAAVDKLLPAAPRPATRSPGG